MNLMQYDLGTNFDDDLIDFIIENDKNHQIKSVFGKLKSDIAGGGRVSVISPEVSLEKLKAHAEKCEKAGIEFNYLINPITLNDAELNYEKNEPLIKFIDDIYNLGIKSFTINSLYLAKYLKNKYPDVRLTVGLYAYPTSIDQMKYWANVGVEEITLDHRCNRNFPLLRNALLAFKGTNVKLRLIANNFCLHECAFKINHGCNIASQSVTNATAFRHIDFNLLTCKSRQVANPAAMITSDWIRPEDVKKYNELCEETGNPNLTIKLVERTRSTAYLKRVAKAYLEESYDGNLLDIMNWPTSDQDRAERNSTPSETSKAVQASAAKSYYRPEMLINYAKIMTSYPKIYIDNKKLDGFVDHFVNNYHCDAMVCKSSVPGDDCQNACNYCKSWADKVVSCPDEPKQQWLELVNEVLTAISDRTVFAPVYNEVKSYID